MGRSWSGPLVTGLIVAGVAAILIFNLQPGRPNSTLPRVTPGPPKPETIPGPNPATVMGVVEHPIGEPVEKNQIQVVAVWLSAVKMEGMAATSSSATDLIHLEADVKATRDNLNGFAMGEFVPYLKIAYSVVPTQGGPAIEKGELSPMIARDGLHYGANILMPKAGDYRLIYEIEPPSAGGLGRHSDPATGVAPWWKPFQAVFSWKVEPDSAVVAEKR